MRRDVLAALLPLCFVLFSYVTACGPHKPVLQDLSGIEEVKAQFNRDSGKPRVVLLLSPT